MKENQRKLGQYLCKKWYSLAIFYMVLMGASFCMFDAGASALTTVPTKTNFQGRLTNSSGNIMPDGLYNMKFRLFTVDTGGSAVWTETRETTNRVQVTNGLFSVRLGDVTPISASLFASGSLYFEVELPTPGTATCSTAACASFTEGPMTPRNQMATSAYAYNSETLDGLDSSNFVQLGQGVQTDAGTASSIFINKTASGNLVQLQSSGTDAFTISNTGAVTTGTWQGSTVGVQYGGTGQSSYAIGDLLYASGATTLSKLAAGVANSCLTSQGVGTAPAWADCEDDTLASVTGRGGTTSSNLTFNGTLGVTSDVTLTLAGTENLAVTSDLSGVTNVFTITGTPSATAGTTRGINIEQANSANANGLDFGLRINNLDTDLPMTAAIQIANTGGGGYTNVISAPSFILDGTGTITAGTWQGGEIQDAYVSNTLTASILQGSGSTTNAVDLGTAEVAGTLAVGNGGTGLASYAIGDLLYASGATTLSKLAAIAAGSCLTSQGVGTAPAWADCEDDTLASVTGRGGTTSSNLVFNGTLGVTSDTTFTFSGTENLVVNSDLAGGVNLLQITGTPSTTAGTARGILVQQADSANTNGLDTGVYINNADTDLAITNAIHINNTGGGGYTNLINATTFTVTGAGAITNGTWNGGTVSVQYGGTGAASFTSGGLLYGNGTGAIQATSAGGASQCLLGGATPTWGTCSLQTAYDRSTGSTTPEIKLDATRGGLDIQDANSTINSDLLTVRTGNASGLGTGMFTVASTGAITSQNISDSTAAFTISRAGTSGSIFVADTSNSRIQIGSATADSTGVVLVLDTKDIALEPAGVDGAMYYNSEKRSFRCYQNGVWRSCMGGLAYANTAPATTITAGVATEQAFSTTHTIPAGSCQPGRVYRVTARGVYTTPNPLGGIGTLTLRVRIGGVTGAQAGATPAVALTKNLANRLWRVSFDVTCITYGNPGTVEGQGTAEIFTGVSAAASHEMVNTGTVGAINMTANQTIGLSAQYSVAEANKSITLRQIIVEELGP